MCKLFRNTASGYGNASNTIMTQHLGILSKGFWIGEEFKLVKNQYTTNLESDIQSPIFSPMIAILDVYYMNPAYNPKKPEKAPEEKVDPFAHQQ